MLDAWLNVSGAGAAGSASDDFPSVKALAEGAARRDVFNCFINGAKGRVPDTAKALLARFGLTPASDAQE